MWVYYNRGLDEIPDRFEYDMLLKGKKVKVLVDSPTFLVGIFNPSRGVVRGKIEFDDVDDINAAFDKAAEESFFEDGQIGFYVFLVLTILFAFVIIVNLVVILKLRKRLATLDKYHPSTKEGLNTSNSHYSY